MRLLRSLVIVWAAMALAMPAMADEWKQILDRDGIVVCSRPVAGSTMDEFKGVTVVAAPIEVCTAVLHDIPSQPEWMGDNLQADVLKVFTENHQVAYNVLSAPWPLRSRDLQIEVVFNENFEAGNVLVEMSAYPEVIVPITSKYVRITDFKASCRFERIDADHTRVIYINRVNPMAPVPSTITNMVVRGNPYATLSGLKEMVKKDKYRQVAGK